MRIIAFLAVALALVAAWLVLRPRLAASETVITVDQIPRVFGQMAQSHANPTFAAFAFMTPDRPAVQDAINLQFSMEGGRPGFDWVLIAPRNIQDKDRFLAFAASAGYAASAKEMNGVKYLRVEDGDLPQLCMSVVTGMYGLKPSDQIDLIAEGFEWRP